MELYGRTVIYTSEESITRDNVVDVLTDAIPVFEKNRFETQILYDYYCGKQAVYDRVKDVRPEICHKIVENRANEIVSFKTGYLMGEPVQYISRGNDVSEQLNVFNEYMTAEGKDSKDKEIADWFHISGHAYRMIKPDKKSEMDEAPFEIYTLDPRETFVVRHSGLGHKVLMGVIVVAIKGVTRYCCYTDRRYFEIEEGKIIKEAPNGLRAVPIIEYPANMARLGAFEIVIDLIDALNDLASDRLDGVDQFIQALMVFKGVDIDSDDFAQLRKEGALKVPPDGDVKYLIQELNQGQTQTLVDYTYQTMLDICGMPNRNGGSSTSDNGVAVIYRDGWTSAETRAKDSEMMFKKSEKEFLRLAIKIANEYRQLDLRASQIDPHFTRRNYENIQSKSQVLTTMLSNNKIHPRLAFEYCGMFVDPEAAYIESMEYEKKAVAEEQARLDMQWENEVNAVTEER